MEYAVYRTYRADDGRKMGTLIDVLATREEAEAFAEARLSGQGREVVGLHTREIGEDDEYLWRDVSFNEAGGIEPAGER